MARRRQGDEAEGGVALPAELIDAMAAHIRTPAEFQAIYRQSPKALTERVLKAELTHHLGYLGDGQRPQDGDARNRATPQQITTDTGVVDLDTPRDRSGTFTPHFVAKSVRRLPGFDDTVLQLSARVSRRAL